MLGPVGADDDSVAPGIGERPAAFGHDQVEQRAPRRQRSCRQPPQQREHRLGRSPLGQVDVQHDLAAGMPDRGVPQPLDQADRLRVGCEHRRVEAADALLAGARDEPLQQRRRDAAPLPVVGDHDRRLGRALGRAHEARDADAASARLGVDRHQRLVVVVVDAGQVVEIALGQLGLGPEEPPVLRLAAEPAMPLGQRLAVGRLDRADEDARAVAQLDLVDHARAIAGDCRTARGTVRSFTGGPSRRRSPARGGPRGAVGLPS